MSFRRISPIGGLGATRNAFPQAHPLTALFARSTAPDQERSDSEQGASVPQNHLFTALLEFVAVSAIAGLLIAVAVTPALALAGKGASGIIGGVEELPAALPLPALGPRPPLHGP